MQIVETQGRNHSIFFIYPTYYCMNCTILLLFREHHEKQSPIHIIYYEHRLVAYFYA